MTKNRLEAFSDGVIAILITIMVLELQLPAGSDLAALRGVAPLLVTYALSFVFVGIYWNNHHHMIHAAEHIDGRVLWANLHLLFWLSLIPFATNWLGVSGFAPVPTAAYGVLMLACGAAHYVLARTLLAIKTNHRLAKAVGNDRKGPLSLVIYAAAVPVALFSQSAAIGLYVLVAAIWLIPDRRIESMFRPGA